GRIVAAGDEAEVRRAAGNGDQTIDLGERLILPALVNAHAHLDLTAIGPRPYEGDFIKWVEMVIRLRPRTSQSITTAVHAGLSASVAAGTGWLGDIAGSVDAVRARLHPPNNESWINGVSYLEVLGFGPKARSAASQLSEDANAVYQALPEDRRFWSYVSL